MSFLKIQLIRKTMVTGKGRGEKGAGAAEPAPQNPAALSALSGAGAEGGFTEQLISLLQRKQFLNHSEFER